MIRILKPVRFCYRLPGDDFSRTDVVEPSVSVGPLGEQALLVPLADDEWQIFGRLCATRSEAQP